jgi:tripeptidyl-peptidase-1
MKVLVTLSLLVAVAAAVNVVVQRPKELAKPWQDTGVAVDKSKIVAVTIQLKRPNAGSLATVVTERATPGSPRFRDWLSFEEARRALRPRTDSVAAVEKWLQEAGVQYTQSELKDQFQLRLSVGQAETLFETFFHVVRNPTDGMEWHHASTIHAPAYAAEHVAVVYGVHGLPLPKKRESRAKKAPQDIVNVGPADISKTYKVSGRGSGSKKVRQAVAEFQGQFANTDDLTMFFKNLVPNAKPGDEKVYAYKGNKDSGDGIEALLDIEYIMGMAPGVLTEFWGWQNFDFCQDLKNWTTTILNDQDPPVVFSVSYGWQGPLSQLGCEDPEIKDIDEDFMTIAGRGISIIFASGDSGSGYDGTTLWPSWPASSPYVTAVGSTCFTDSTMSQQEATTQFGSGSGFSTMFKQPSYQHRAVTKYLATASGLPPSGDFPKDGRASADVSALGEGYQVYVDGSIEIVGGTSASAPCFSALVSLVNDYLDRQGKKPLGFLNPWIYNNTGMFTDITMGTDKIDRGGDPVDEGFDCTTGWDPATGLGVPIFPKMKLLA